MNLHLINLKQNLFPFYVVSAFVLKDSQIFSDDWLFHLMLSFNC